jgi:hypothetical protein
MSDFNASPEQLSKVAAVFGLSTNEEKYTPPTSIEVDADAPDGQEVATEGEPEAVAANDGFADFEWDGFKTQLPANVADSLKKAVLRNEDYTRKTQGLSEAQKKLEHVQALAEQHATEIAFAHSISAEQQELTQLDQALKQVSSIDWAKLSTDEMLRSKIAVDGWRDRRAQLAESINGKRSQFVQQLQARISELRGKSKEQASKSIDGFSEDTDRTIREYAKSEGLTERETDNLLLDPRAYRLFWKASQFDSIKAKAAKGTNPDATSGVLRPGVAGERMSKETASKLNFSKAMKSAREKGSQHTANLIEDRLARSIFKGKK